jgi:hypothetical protein
MDQSDHQPDSVVSKLSELLKTAGKPMFANEMDPIAKPYLKKCSSAIMLAGMWKLRQIGRIQADKPTRHGRYMYCTADYPGAELNTGGKKKKGKKTTEPAKPPIPAKVATAVVGKVTKVNGNKVNGKQPTSQIEALIKDNPQLAHELKALVQHQVQTVIKRSGHAPTEQHEQPPGPATPHGFPKEFLDTMSFDIGQFHLEISARKPKEQG